MSSPDPVPERSWIPGTRFTVDAFRTKDRPRATASDEQSAGNPPWRFFLSHWHSDHYTGLTDAFDEGTIFCSEITAKLMALKLGNTLVDRCVRVMPINEEIEVDGVTVTAIDANHCPGAVQFLFRVPCGSSSSSEAASSRHVKRYIHCGDCRWSPDWRTKSTATGRLLSQFVGCDAIFLDTTYVHSRKFVFPSMKATCDYIANVVHEALRDGSNTGTVGVLISTYGIGKEHIMFSILDKCQGERIHVSERRLASLRCYTDEAVLSRNFTTCATESRIHVIDWGSLGDVWPFFRPNFHNMELHRARMGWERCIGFVSTGWVTSTSSTSSSRRSNSGVHIRSLPEMGVTSHKKEQNEIFLVPYSEHSSFAELREYVEHIRPKQLIPTVGDGARGGVYSKARGKVTELFRDLVDSGSAKRDFLARLAKDDAVDEVIRPVGEEDAVGPGKEDTPPSETDGDKQEDTDKNARFAGRPKYDDADGSFKAGRIDDIDALAGVVGDRATAEELLRVAGGDLDRAANLYLDNSSANGHRRTMSSATTPKATWMGDNRKQGSTSKNKKRKLSEGASGSMTGMVSQRSLLSYFTKSPKGEVKEDRDKRAAGGEVENVTAERRGCSELAKTKVQRVQPEADDDTAPARSIETTIPDAAGASRSNCAVEKTDNEGENEHETDSLPYSLVAETLTKTLATQKRLLIYSHFASLFSAIADRNASDLQPAVHLILGKLGEDDERSWTGSDVAQEKKKELSVGGSIVSNAICSVTGASRNKIRELYRKHGDLGDVAAQLKRNQSTLVKMKPLTIKEVFTTLHRIADESGEGSVGRRQALIARLLRSAGQDEIRFIVRTLIANMRCRAQSQTITIALAHAFHEGRLDSLEDSPVDSVMSKESAATRLSRAFSLVPSFSILVRSLLNKGLVGTVNDVRIRIGIPCKPQLAKVAHGVDDVVSFFSGAKEKRSKSDATCNSSKEGAQVDATTIEILAERKYDGMRAQIHILDSGDVHIYSRNCDNVTARFPDVVGLFHELASSNDSIRGSIFDSEIVAVDRETGKLRAFQELSSRAKLGSNRSGDAKQEVDVCVMVFDILCAARMNLVDKPLANRRGEITAILPSMIEGRIQMAHSKTFVVTRQSAIDDSGEDINSGVRSEIATYFEDSISQQCEGLMFKMLRGPESLYSPNSRSSWLKLKRDYCEAGRDTLDLVPIGAWYGNGRKAGWFSPILMACYNQETEMYESVCRVMSGFTDEFYKMKTAFYSERIQESTAKPIYFDTNESCSVWFKPCEVWEIVGADYTLSPVHTAGNTLIGDSDGKGIGLRFPRFIGERSDKDVEDATDSETIYELFLAQSRRI